MSPTSLRSATTSPMSAGTTSWVVMSAATTRTKSSNGDLWALSFGSATASEPAGSKSIRGLEKEKAEAGIWGVQN
ncbi:hypothetical protein BGW80DRAFT_1358633 [Lactifluus volemus]|nr:hypothetical protein BGW80DRAFT_1358633 [Lactifluus volemus]